METIYKPIDCGFHDHLEAAATLRKYVKLQYFTELHEFMTVMTVVKDVFTKDKEEYLALSTGEEIRLDRIIRIDDTASPTFEHIDDFTCDC